MNKLFGQNMAPSTCFWSPKTNIRPNLKLWRPRSVLASVFICMFCVTMCHGQTSTTGPSVPDDFTSAGVISTKEPSDPNYVNDHSPVFPKSTVSISLSEGTQIGENCPLDLARDGDEGNFSTQGYRILSGSTNNIFDLKVQRELNGVVSVLNLVVKNSLDRETTPNYNLVIEAYDGGFPPRSGNMTLNITILDVNDNPPIFSQMVYSVTLNETLEVGSQILKVTASDVDEGVNGAIIYEVRPQSDPHKLFRIDPRTGWLSLNKTLDYEISHSVVLIITARDNTTEPEICSVYVLIHVLTGQLNISEAANPGHDLCVYEVSINDLNENESTNVNVTFVGGEGKFDIVTRKNPYFIYLKSSLDREKVSSYPLSITITIRGFGTPPLRTQQNITIMVDVDDINDNPPIFDKVEYAASISDNVEGFRRIHVHASDADVGDNAAITYRIIHELGTHFEWFINPLSGLITTNQSIDRGIAETVTLTVEASDAGVPPLSANVSVIIMLSYNATLQEDTPNNTCSLLQICGSSCVRKNCSVCDNTTKDTIQSTDKTVWLCGPCILSYFRQDEYCVSCKDELSCHQIPDCQRTTPEPVLDVCSEPPNSPYLTVVIVCVLLVFILVVIVAALVICCTEQFHNPSESSTNRRPARKSRITRQGEQLVFSLTDEERQSSPARTPCAQPMPGPQNGEEPSTIKTPQQDVFSPFRKHFQEISCAGQSANQRNFEDAVALTRDTRISQMDYQDKRLLNRMLYEKPELLETSPIFHYVKFGELFNIPKEDLRRINSAIGVLDHISATHTDEPTVGELLNKLKNTGQCCDVVRELAEQIVKRGNQHKSRNKKLKGVSKVGVQYTH